MRRETSKQTEQRWTKIAKDMLEGRTIKKVRYLSVSEMEDLGWYNRCVVIVLDDGNIIYPSRDDEGNDAGSLFTMNSDNPTLPVI